MHNAYNFSYFISVKTTLNIDEQIFDKSRSLTGIKEKTALDRMGLEALTPRESAKRFAKSCGTEKNLEPIPRRRY